MSPKDVKSELVIYYMKIVTTFWHSIDILLYFLYDTESKEASLKMEEQLSLEISHIQNDTTDIENSYPDEELGEDNNTEHTKITIDADVCTPFLSETTNDNGKKYHITNNTLNLNIVV